jgi:hypothetical protein
MILFTPLPHRFDWHRCREVLSGCAPDRAVTFFCLSKRKSPKKKRAEVRAPAGFLALLASDGVGLNSLRSNIARPDPSAAALLSPATRRGDKNSQIHCRHSIPHAVIRRRVAQGAAELEAQMFEPAGRVSAPPADPEQRSVPAAKRRDDESGSPLLCLLSFGEAKESESPAGARPGLHLQPKLLKKISTLSLPVTAKTGNRAKGNVRC